MEPAGEQVIKDAAAASPLMEEYGTPVDNESAYEILQKRAEKDAEAEDAAAAEKSAASGKGAAAGSAPAAEKKAAARTKKDEGLMDNPAVKSFLRSAGTVLGREISRSLFGTRKRR
jgi:Ni,Fe-hydrogenase I small subunit